jgi:anti-sigma B factor antagonist
MSEETQRFNVSAEDGITIAELTDRKILDGVNIMQIEERLFQIVAEADLPKLVLDFTNVAYMSSRALGMLITLNKRIREKSGKLALCCIQPSIREIFEITRLAEIFTICSARAEAIAALT